MPEIPAYADLPACAVSIDNPKGVRTMKGMHFKSEIAQRELSDLEREVHAWCIPSAL
jgi:hypothetical protein